MALYSSLTSVGLIKNYIDKLYALIAFIDITLFFSFSEKYEM